MHRNCFHNCVLITSTLGPDLQHLVTPDFGNMSVALTNNNNNNKQNKKTTNKTKKVKKSQSATVDCGFCPATVERMKKGKY